MKGIISILLLSLIVGCCTVDLNKEITGKEKSLKEDGNCFYTLDYDAELQFIAPCDCFNVGDIPVYKIIKDNK